ncbi:hypothetical protein Mpsy_0609 [Methanolobus psychrophilus R15]|nr:hypothetical protein Mpsy_0609 [Methanolobus psychrophilus R15]
MIISIDIPPAIENILDKRSQEQHLNRESVIKQMLWEGAENYLIEEYANGRISKGKLAEMLDLNIYEVNELLEKHHVKGSISYENFVTGVEMAEKHSKYSSEKEQTKKE